MDETIKLSLAAVRGVAGAVTGFAHMVAHPLDTVLYPVSSLVYDAAIVTAAHGQWTGPDDQACMPFRLLVDQHPQLYHNAVHRFQQRVDEAKREGASFEKASLEVQVEKIAYVVTSFYLPGAMIKGVRMVGNSTVLGVANPPKFHVLRDADAAVEPLRITKYTREQVRAAAGHQRYQYVVTADRELILAPYQSEKPFLRYSTNGQRHLAHEIYHSETSGFRKVYSAGDVHVENGRIVRIDNLSGHYKPRGDHLERLINNVFQKHGYDEVVPGIYKPFIYTAEVFEQPIMSKLKTPLMPGAVLQAIPPTPEKEEEEDDNGNEFFMEPVDDDDDDEYVQKQEQFKQAAAVAQQALSQFVLAPQTKDVLLNTSKTLRDFGEIGSHIAQAALLLGGHERTWRGVHNVSMGAISLAQNLSMIAGAQTMLSMTALTGVVGAGVALISIAAALMGNDDADPDAEFRQAVMSALQTIHQDMMRGFRRLEDMVMVCILNSLVTNAKLDRLERVCGFAFRELHRKELIDIIYSIEKSSNGEYALSATKHTKLLHKLARWIDLHSKSPIQTSAMHFTSDQHAVFLDDGFDATSMFALMLHTLVGLFPELRARIAIDSVPNLPLFTSAVHVYLVATHGGGGGGNTVFLQRTLEVYRYLNGVIQLLQSPCLANGSATVAQMLERQYRRLRADVGRALWKCPRNGNTLVEGTEKHSLMNVLQEMDVRRVLLIKLATLTGQPVPENLESQAQILATASGTYTEMQMYQLARAGDVQGTRTYLQYGCDPTVLGPHNGSKWGTVMHYAAKYAPHEGNACVIMHNILSTYPKDVSGTEHTYCNIGDTWGHSNSTLILCLNQAFMGRALLLCAHGVTISELDGRCGGRYDFSATDMGNLYWWNDDNPRGWYGISIEFVKQTNIATSVFAKEKLRRAYTYYKRVEAGQIADVQDVSIECVLLLTCIIGDLLPLRALNVPLTPAFVNTLIPGGIDITYAAFAAKCGQDHVVHYLVSQCGARLNVPMPKWPNFIVPAIAPAAPEAGAIPAIVSAVQLQLANDMQLIETCIKK